MLWRGYCHQIVLCCGVCLALPQAAALAEFNKSPRSISDLSLEELLQIEIGVASAKSTPQKLTPAVVSLITRDEIENSGARDLIDVLRMVPGFEFGSDVEGVIGPAFRGHWGHEGKILLLLDGHEVNEIMFSNLAFGNHFSVDQIERIEIIRGPGSVIYGGYAELAVIKIITKLGDEKNQVHTSFQSGWMQDDYARQNLQLTAGKNIDENIYFGASGFLGYANRSDQEIADFFGNHYNLSGNSQLSSTNLNLRARIYDLTLNYIYDDYNTRDRYPNDAVAPQPYGVVFTSHFLRALYKTQISDAWLFSQEIRYKNQKPWHNTPPPDPNLVDLYEAIASRLSIATKLQYTPNQTLGILWGGQWDYDLAYYSAASPIRFADGSQRIDYYNIAAFTEATLNLPWFNLNLGLRFENHEQAGNSIVPRLSINKSLGAYHAKALYNRAFRAPSIENLHNNPAIRPEFTDTYELELGYQPDANTQLLVNFFDIAIDDPIIFYFDTANNLDTYINRPEVGTRGLEFIAKGHYSHITSTLSYSYYTVTDNLVPDYAIATHGDLLLGLPTHKITGICSFKLFEHLYITPSFIFVSQRYGYLGDGSGGKQIEAFSPELTLNLYALYRNAFWNGLDLGFGIFDITQQNHHYIQPYDGDHTPIPGTSQEWTGKISYHWGKS